MQLNVICFALILSCLTSSLQAQSPFAFTRPPESFQFVSPVVHRGFARIAPENTLPAFQACISDFIPWAEVDVRLTRDGQHVLLHDSTLQRTTNGKGNVVDFTLENIGKFDAGSWFAKRFEGTQIPSLNEALVHCQGKLNLYLDCKAVHASTLVQEILRTGMQKQVVVYGSVELAKEVRRLSQGKVAVMVKWQAETAWHQLPASERPDAVEIDAEDFTPERARLLEQAGIRLLINCLGQHRDTPQTWLHLLKSNQHWIQTDDPAGLVMTAARRLWPEFPVKISAHRGASRYAPENTLPAIQEAVRLGMDYVEIDIRTAQDSSLFLLHDGNLRRTTTGQGPIKAQTAAQLAGLDAGIWFSSRWKQTPMPRFDESLAALGKSTGVYLDAKDIAPQALIDSINKHQLWDRHVVYQSPEYLLKLKQLDARIRLMPALRSHDDLPRIAAMKPYAVDAAWKALSKELIDDCHKQGIQVFSDALGFNESVPQYQKAIRWGIDVIQTDHPLRVVRAIEGLKEGK